MKIDYDQASDILTMLFSSSPVEESDEVKPGVILDYDAVATSSASKFWMPAAAWRTQRLWGFRLMLPDPETPASLIVLDF